MAQYFRGWEGVERRLVERGCCAEVVGFLISGNTVAGWHLRAWLLACFQSDKVRFCCLALLKTYIPWLFYSWAMPHRWSSLYKSRVQPFVSAQVQLSSICHRGTDWLCITFDSLVLLSFWSQRSNPRRYTTVTVICFDLSKASKAISEEARCHVYTQSVIQLTQFSYTLVANTVMVQFILRLKSFLDRWSHQQSSSLLQPLLPPSITWPVCPVLIGTFQFMNHLK